MKVTYTTKCNGLEGPIFNRYFVDLAIPTYLDHNLTHGMILNDLRKLHTSNIDIVGYVTYRIVGGQEVVHLTHGSYKGLKVSQ